MSQKQIPNTEELAGKTFDPAEKDHGTETKATGLEVTHEQVNDHYFEGTVDKNADIGENRG
ncbi:YozQ family protein [Metabacillus sp. RGM 3146]|uniref:YozQ family protein n=1 Tax=Metabacillus sp. RGM 3146 TaxID=3401092 RepID=UPI003B99AA1C